MYYEFEYQYNGLIGDLNIEVEPKYEDASFDAFDSSGRLATQTRRELAGIEILSVRFYWYDENDKEQSVDVTHKVNIPTYMINEIIEDLESGGV